MVKKRYKKWNRYSRYEISEIIFKLLKGYKQGLTIIEISKYLAISRKVVGEEIRLLADNNKIKLSPVGTAILCYGNSYYKK